MLNFVSFGRLSVVLPLSMGVLLLSSVAFANEQSMSVIPFYEKPSDDVIQQTLSGLNGPQQYGQMPGAIYVQPLSPLPDTFTVPKSTTFSAKLLTSLKSTDSKVGDQFELILAQDILTETGVIVIPAGSHVLGEVMSVSTSGYPRRKAKMELHFLEATTPSGRQFSIDATVKNGALKGNQTVAAKKQPFALSIAQTALGMGAGMMAGPVGGIGVKAGMMVFGKKGKEVVLNAGAPITIELQAPLTQTSVLLDPAPKFASNPYVPAIQVGASANLNNIPARSLIKKTDDHLNKPAYQPASTERMVSMEQSFVPVNYSSTSDDMQDLTPVNYVPSQATVNPVKQIQRRIDIE